MISKNMIKLPLLDNFTINLFILIIWHNVEMQTTDSITSNRLSRSTSSMINFNGLPITRLYVSIPEELTPGSLVLDLHKNPKISNFITDQNALLMHNTGSYRYRLLNAFDSYLFRIGPKTGKVTVATRLDREALCSSLKAQFCCNTRSVNIPPPVVSDSDWKLRSTEMNPSQQCYLVVHISLQPDTEMNQNVDTTNSHQQDKTNRAALIYLYIHLEDINDHTPQFSAHSIDLNVMEDTPVGSVLHYFRISDPDIGVNSLESINLTVVPLPNLAADQSTKLRQTNFLIPDLLSKPFEVLMTRDGATFSLRNQLDREIVPAYDVTLVALDGNKQNPRSSQIGFRVHVADVNDNPPKWLKQKSISDVQTLNYEHDTNLEIENDYPRFLVSVPENTQVGALIFWLQARDADIGENARLQYLVDTSAPGGLVGADYLSIQPNTGEVRLRTQLDYEMISMQINGPEIDVPIVVHDNPRNGRQLSARATLVIRVLDVNDVHPTIVATPLAPVLSSGSFYPNSVENNHVTSVFGIWENQPPGQPVATIHVSDPDTGDGGVVACTITSEHFRLVTESSSSSSRSPYETLYDTTSLDAMKPDYNVPKVIEALSGSATYQLISAQRLDRETTARHQVLLTCRDHDTVKPLVFTYRLDIEVMDENDNPPIISLDKLVLTCPENSSPGKVIGRLNVTDADIGENARLRFWIDEADVNWINIQPNTGEIRVNTVFDRELEPERAFTVYVSDSGVNAHTASAEIKIEILDENDHTPHFTDLYFFSIPENSSPDTEVGQIHAVDEDIGDNGKVQYFLRQPSREFDLDKTTGKLTVRKNIIDISKYHSNELFGKFISLLDREQKDAYELTVYAEDCGNPSRRATTIVHISISDVNDHAPEFRYPTPHGTGSLLNISCAQLGSQIIAHVQANDSDTGRNGDIEYSIIRQHTRHQLQKVKRSGVDGDVSGDAEDNSENNVSIGKTSQLNQTVLTDTKDSKIVPNVKNKTIELINASNSRHVKWAPSSQVLSGGPTEEHFDIDSYSGQLFLIHPIFDCSQSVDVRLLIQATDGGQPSKSSTAQLTLHIYPAIVSNELDNSNHQNDNSNSNNNNNNFPSVTDIRRNLDFSRRTSSNTNAWTDHKNSRSVYQQVGFSVSSPSMSSNQRNMSNYHWSAIVGLIVAMIVLVLLLCLMLIILRRRFIIDARKLPTKDKSTVNIDGNKYQTMVGMTIRSNDTTIQDIYNRSGSQIGQQLHEVANNSQAHSTFSTKTLSPHPGEEFNCSPISTMLFDTHHHSLVSNNFFRTLPITPSTATAIVSPSTGVALNTGEVALIQHDPMSIQNRSNNTTANNNNNLCNTEQPQSIYKGQNSELYGYIDTQPRRKKLILQGNAYQTLQTNHHQNLQNMSSFNRIMPADFTNTTNYIINNGNNGNNNDPLKRSVTQYPQYKTGQYTPLLDMNNQKHMVLEQLRLVQASQPNLCIGFQGDRDDDEEGEDRDVNDIEDNISNNNNRNNTIDDCHSFGHTHRKESLTNQERAFSLTNLIPQKTEIMSFNEYNKNNNAKNKNNINGLYKSKNYIQCEPSSPSVNKQLQPSHEGEHQHQRLVLVNNKMHRLKHITSPTTTPTLNMNHCVTLKPIQSKNTTDDITKNTISDTITTANNSNSNNINSYCTVSFV
ncbi:Protocadherin-7 [Schistosoma japonicum]|nr:Protocadherin-7 [Schistosoma japonicum]